jgi:hypothetical protein
VSNKTNFDPIPRLQQIAATIEESGADIFDAPNTAVHYINCAIKEIEQLRKERNEARREVCNATAHPDMEAHERGWDCFKDNP